jgi:aspartate/methionine/tyrosine aminotransferase
MANALKQIGFDVPVIPDGAFYFYVDVSQYTDDSMALALDILDKAHVAVVPGIDFSQADAKRYLRISYANSMSNLEEAINRLGQYLASLSR